MTKASILIVEDEGLVSKDIQTILMSTGYKISGIASSGEMAVTKAGESLPDLVLMDIVLHGKMDGIEAAQCIHSFWGIPIIYLTAYGDNNMVERAKSTNPLAYLIKPFSEQELITTIEISYHQYLASREASKAAIQEKEEELTQFFKLDLNLLCITDIEGNFRSVNNGWKKTLGYLPEELEKHNYLDFVHPEDIDATSAVMSDLSTGKKVENLVNRYRNKDGTYAWIEWCFVPYENRIIYSSARDITVAKHLESELINLSIRDYLTGLYNRSFFEGELDRFARGREFPISIIFVDVDHLKQTNDSQGHAAGDELLKRVAQVFAAAFRAEDITARIGGDEFAILLPKTDKKAAKTALSRVRIILNEHNNASESPPLQLSLGVSTAEKGDTLTDVLKEADKRMYLEKQVKNTQK